MQIGILEAEVMPESLQDYGSFADLFTHLLDAKVEKYEINQYFVINDEFPISVDSNDAYLITGSTFGAYENVPWINRLKQFVREISDAGLPLIGVCFGHQLIAEALGGKVEKYHGGWGVGRHQYDIHQTNLGPSCDSKQLTLNAFHQDQIIKLPKNTEVFASSDFCQYAGLVYGNKILTLQAHPEFSIEFETDLTRDEISTIVPQAIRQKALADLNSPDAHVDNNIISQMMKNLLSEKH